MDFLGITEVELLLFILLLLFIPLFLIDKELFYSHTLVRVVLVTKIQTTSVQVTQ